MTLSVCADTNPENFAKKMSLWCGCNTIGYLIRKGIIDPETIWALQSDGPLYTSLIHNTYS